MSTTEQEQFIVQQLYDRFGDQEVIGRKVHQSQNFMEAIRDLIQVCGDDPEREGLQETPYRVLKAFLEYTEGYKEDPKLHLEKVFAVQHQGLIMVKNIEFHSMCEHHFAPFFGEAHIAYIPGEKITGLSKIARMVEGYSKRFQVQERLTNQIVRAMDEMLVPQGVMAVVEAKHMCMCGRGVRKSDAMTMTTATSGIFSDSPEKRMEVLSLIGK